MSTAEFVKVEKAGGIAEVVIDRPKALNALNRQVLAELGAVFHGLQTDELLRCVILTGAGSKAFVAGADIAEMATLEPPEAEAFARQGHELFATIERLPVPVLAAVNGFALGGGCELVLACDIAYASENAKFGQPEVKLGLIPGFGGTVRLPRKIGYAAAAEWILAGDIHTAASARELGLVREICAPDGLMPRVREVAKTIASRAPLAVRAAKRAMLQGLAVDPASAGQLEQWAFGTLFSTQDLREGTRAFVEKREPAWQAK